MNGSQIIYDELNKRWKSTCRLLLNEEVGELKDFEPWLSERRERFGFTSVTQGGKKISMFMPRAQEQSRIVPFENVDFNRKFEPLSINEIKDIDSIIAAVQERIAYTGNVVLGTSKNVEASNDAVDSFYVKDSAQVWSSKYISHSCTLEYGECLFGCTYNGHFKFCIRSHSGDYLTRGLETERSYESSDCSYCSGVSGARNSMFCFNIRNPVNRIGNIALSQGKYNSIKSKLLSELAQMLMKEKRIPSLFELAGMAEPDFSAIENAKKPAPENYGNDTNDLEAEFSSTGLVLLGKKLGGMKKYEKWLSRFSSFPQKRVKSAFDGKELSIPDYCNNSLYPEDRIMGRSQANAVGESATGTVPDDLSLATVPALISPIAFFSHEYNLGKSLNLLGTEVTVSAVNCLDSTIIIESKNCAYDCYAVESNSIFGSNSIRKSSYALKCYLSTNLNRCFEVDSSRTCTDLYFSHDCENVHDSMFCFNTKNKRNSIGNAELPKEKYAAIKEKVKTELADELEKKGALELSVFSLLE